MEQIAFDGATIAARFRSASNLRQRVCMCKPDPIHVHEIDLKPR